MIELKVAGMDALAKAMRDLPVELHAKALRPAVAAAAAVVRKQAIANAPVQTGELKKAIRQYRSRSRSSAQQEAYCVGVAQVKRKYANTRKNVRATRAGKTYQADGDAFYWRFVEFGTSKMAARPFIRPAFETTKAAQLEAMATRLAAWLRKRGGE